MSDRRAYDLGLFTREDPSLAPPGSLISTKGCEYRPKDRGVWTARGRTIVGTDNVVDAQQLNFIEFTDTGNSYLLLQNNDLLYIYLFDAGSGTFLWQTVVFVGPGSASVVHFDNRFYYASGTALQVIEEDTPGHIIVYAAGIPAPDGLITVATSGVGTVSAVIGVEYWYTWSNETSGFEGPAMNMGGVRAVSTGVFTNKTQVDITRLGAPPSVPVTHWKLYRSLDGGGYPDGGLVATIPVSTSSYSDVIVDIKELPRPYYAKATIGDLVTDRDTPPVNLAWVTSFNGALLGADANDTHSILCSEPGFSTSWPGIYEAFIQPTKAGESVAGLAIGSLAIIFFTTTVSRLLDLPITGGVVDEPITNERGTYNTGTVAKFNLGPQELAAFVAFDGIWATDGSRLIDLTAPIDWESLVDVAQLASSQLAYDSSGQRLVFIYTKLGGDPGVMYIHTDGDRLRVMSPDHGRLTAIAEGQYQGKGRVFSTGSVVDRGAGVSGPAIFLENEGVKDYQLFSNAEGGVAVELTGRDEYPRDPGVFENIAYVNFHHSKPDYSLSATDKSPNLTFTYKYEAPNDRGDLPTKNVANIDFSERGTSFVQAKFDADVYKWTITKTAPVEWRLDWTSVDFGGGGRKKA